MKAHPRRQMIAQIIALIVLLAISVMLAVAMADEAPALPSLSAKDIAGKAVDLGPAGRPALLLFMMPGQPQSAKAAEIVRGDLKQAKGVKAVAVFNGQGSADAAKALADWPGAVVVDADYALAGALDVHVWPSVAALPGDGGPAVSLHGLPRSFASDLGNVLELLAGTIGRDEYARRTSAGEVIADNPSQMASRHLLTAERLLAKGLLAASADELARGLKLEPGNVDLQLAYARLMLLQGQPQRTMELLDKVDASAAPPWRIDMIRGRALIAMDRWEQAAAVLARAVKLNPEPAEAFYGLGLVYEHQQDWPRASAAYRAAFEHSATGRKVVAPPAGGPEAATTRPAEE